MSGSGRETLLDVREWSGGPPECPGVVGRPSRKSRIGREALRHIREFSVSPPRMSESGQEAIPDVRE